MRRLILAALLLLSVVAAMPTPPAAAADVVNRITLLADAYVNGSEAGVLAILNFTTGSPPNPALVDPVDFTWIAPNGTAAFSESVDPDAFGFAISRHRPGVVGTWRVNATYTGNLSVTATTLLGILPEVWTPGTRFLSGNVEVSSGANLTILPGAIVRFDGGGRLTVRGRILAAGTPASPIVLTSNASSPARGDWRGVRLTATAANDSILRGLEVSYAEEGVSLEGVAVNVTASTFRTNGEGVRVAAANASVEDCLFDGNTVGIHVVGARAELLRNVLDRNVNGVLFEGGDGHRVADSAFSANSGSGLRLDGATNVTAANLTLAGDAVGLRLQDATATATAALVTGGAQAIRAIGTSLLSVDNSTLSNAILAEDSARITATAVTVLPLASPVISAAPAASVVIRNSVAVRAEAFEDGLPLAGVSVRIFEDARLAGDLLTDAGGVAPTLWLNDRTYAPTLRENTTRIVLARAGYGFEDNNLSTWDLDLPLTVTFRGSSADADGDGTVDFLDPDDDNDGLPDTLEASLGSNTTDADSDDDAMPDGWEFDAGLDLTDPADAAGDGDSDGLANLDEYRNATDPRREDTDVDLLPDGWEVSNGLDPLNATDAGQDPDVDGFTSREEFAAGTDPRDALSRPPPRVGTIRGWVRDTAGQPLAGALIRLSDGTMASTGTDGAFTFGNVTPGTYAANATLPGYRVRTVAGIHVEANRIVNVTFVLARGPGPRAEPGGTPAYTPWVAVALTGVLVAVVLVYALWERREDERRRREYLREELRQGRLAVRDRERTKTR